MSFNVDQSEQKKWNVMSILAKSMLKPAGTGMSVYNQNKIFVYS